MEAVAESPDPLVRAIEDAHGPVSEPLRSSEKIGACSLAGVAIIETAPATARVVGPKHGARTAALVNVAITCLLAPLDPAWPPAPDPKIRAAGDLGEEDRGRSAIGDFVNTDGSGNANFRVVTVGHSGLAAGDLAFAGKVEPIIFIAGMINLREAPVVARTHELFGPELNIGHRPTVDRWAARPNRLLQERVRDPGARRANKGWNHTRSRIVLWARCAGASRIFVRETLAAARPRVVMRRLNRRVLVDFVVNRGRFYERQKLL